MNRSSALKSSAVYSRRARAPARRVILPRSTGDFGDSTSADVSAQDFLTKVVCDVGQHAHCDATAFDCRRDSLVVLRQTAIGDVLQKAYRWQYIVSGVQEPRFAGVLSELVTPAQMERIGKALAPILTHVGH